MMISAATKRHIYAVFKSQSISLMDEEEPRNEAVKYLTALSDQSKKIPFLFGSDTTV